MDGKIIDKDEKTGLMIIEYKDGSHEAVDLSPDIAKNGGGGFYISNTKATKYKKGDKVKAGDIVAANEDYFREGSNGVSEYAIGNLTKICVHSGYFTLTLGLHGGNIMSKSL